MKRKWVVLGFYDDRGTHFCVQARKTRFGFIRFRTRLVAGRMHHSGFVPPKIDVNDQWRILTEPADISLVEFIDAATKKG